MTLVCGCTNQCPSCGQCCRLSCNCTPSNIEPVMVGGDYRVVDGRLFRLVKGSGPFSDPCYNDEGLL